MMKQLLIFFIITELLLGFGSVYAQNGGVVPEEQKNFFEGYWKYSSQNRDTVFIIKLKYLPTKKGLNTYIGSYLYYSPKHQENHLRMLFNYLEISTYEKYREVVWERIRSGERDIAIDVWERNYREVTGLFYDYNPNHYYGTLTLSVLSAREGSETIRWQLEEGEGVFMYSSDEDPDEMFNFCVPWDVVLEKVHNLSEFEDIGIVLQPFPKEKKTEEPRK